MRSVVVFALLGLCWYELHTCVHANDAKKNIRKRKLKPSRRLSAYCDCYGVNECNDECEDSNNGVCDDDGSCDVCVPGTDKTDCEKEGGTECSTSSSSSSSSSGGSNYAGYGYGFDDSTAAIKKLIKNNLLKNMQKAMVKALLALVLTATSTMALLKKILPTISMTLTTLMEHQLTRTRLRTKRTLCGKT